MRLPVIDISTMTALAIMCVAATAARAEDDVLRPFTATYAVEWRGITAGQSSLELTRTAPDRYVYQSRNRARGIFRLAFPEAITQISEFSIVDGQVRPSSYRADEGSRDTSRDVTLNFDWAAGRVTGVSEDQPVDVPIEPGVQDPLSVQIALMRELAAGRSPSSFQLVDDGQVKEYAYTREGETKLKTPLGELATVIYSSTREGSSRVTRLWLAPDLGWLPVRAEQRRRGKIEFAMQLRSLERTP